MIPHELIVALLVVGVLAFAILVCVFVIVGR
jgi:hypothetical protein